MAKERNSLIYQTIVCDYNKPLVTQAQWAA